MCIGQNPASASPAGQQPILAGALDGTNSAPIRSAESGARRSAIRPTAGRDGAVHGWTLEDSSPREPGSVGRVRVPDSRVAARAIRPVGGRQRRAGLESGQRTPCQRPGAKGAPSGTTAAAAAPLLTQRCRWPRPAASVGGSAEAEDPASAGARAKRQPFGAVLTGRSFRGTPGSRGTARVAASVGDQRSRTARQARLPTSRPRRPRSRWLHHPR